MNDHESTPLLHANPNSTARTASESQLPPIAPAVRRVGTLEADHIRFEDLVNQDGLSFENHPTEFAFALTVLLHLRTTRTEASSADDPYERWLAMKIDTRDADVLEKQINDIWTLFLAEYRNTRDIETVLWTRFPFDEGDTHTCRVVDYLVDRDSPVSLVSHPLVTSSIEYAWKRGVSLEYPSANSSAWLARYDMLSTPRVAHFIDWTSHLIFLALLVHYLLYPIEQPHTTKEWLEYQYGAREVLLIILPFSFAARTWSLANTSSLLAPIAFLTSLPSAPHPASITFTLLQWAVVLHPLGLNLPEAPSHLFLLRHSYSLPLAVLIKRGLSRILYPLILFFLPLLLLAIYLLSLSLVDTFLKLSSIEGFSVIITPTPQETRLTFLTFFFAVVLLMFTSLFVMATTTSLAHTSSDPWDRYSVAVGHAARRIFLGVTASYNGPYVFPPPFNILHILLIRIPQVAARRFAIQIQGLAVVERILWRIIVGPFAAFVALLFWRPERLRYSS
ncbi:hypothetical protein FPV67DRAFT_1465265 [Lyophyllum atratum]|nr:hypothetical protein FPV67DRAFT_1465265 [Lyophyllum atratum]